MSATTTQAQRTPPTWNAASREASWAALEERPWDLVVIGGGITGAGIFREAARVGMRVLLVEQRDFAWGSSGRSSKLIHGGLRYLKDGKLGLVRDSVRERDGLLRCAEGLVQPLGFLFASYKGDRPGPRVFGMGLSFYDMVSGQSVHQRHEHHEMPLLAPYIAQQGLRYGFRYLDAQTDDARLVLRLLREGAADGGTALGYVAVEEVVFEQGRAVGARLRDTEADRTAQVRARVVVNATGPWAGKLRPPAEGQERLRPLRGSHLVFPASRLPVPQAVSFLHPDDRRPVFALPWEGAVLLGTTDVDHDQPLDENPRISAAEVDYLMRAARQRFPALDLGEQDVISTYAGVRPVIDTGAANPSAESREHGVWDDGGLITVTGGKLTTFRLMALEALGKVAACAPDLPQPLRTATTFACPVPPAFPPEVSEAAALRLLGRYGLDAQALLAGAEPGDWERVGQTPTLWAELRWAARSEAVMHLEDLLLRRTRVGLLLPEGGLGPDLSPRIEGICRAELGWDQARWRQEADDYAALWRHHHAPPRPKAPGAPVSRTEAG
jgi:glycerol-3-phosphate dehydrogenase